VLENPVGRGLLEPSLVEFGGKYYMTIRAEDEHLQSIKQRSDI
jgi:hypothetical protein